MSEFLTFLVAGIVSGAIYAVTATGLVVTYTVTGVFNFAHGAMGMVLAFLFWQLWQGWGWPAPLALVVVLLVFAPLLGAVVERTMMRRLHGASAGIPLVVTVGLMLLLYGLANTVWPQTSARDLPDFLPNVDVRIGGANGVSVSGEQLITVVVAVLVAVGLRLVFNRTRVGVAMRAVVDDPALAELHGAPAARLSAYAWMIGTALAGVAGILLAPQANMNILQLTLLVVYGYAAAVVGRLRSLPWTVAGALFLGVANAMAVGYAPSSVESYIVAALPMALLFGALLAVPQARLTVGRLIRPRPPRVPSAQASVVGGLAVVAGTLVLVGILGGTALNTFGDAVVLGVLGLSLVLLSGYGGQVSLCQFTFLGLGAWAMARVGGGHSPFGVLAAMGLCAACGAVLALPAIRLRGLYLGLATLAFAVLMDNLFFTSTSVMGTSGTLDLGRPDLLGWHIDGTGTFIVACSIVLAVCLVLVAAIRRSRAGRRLVGMNDSPAACATVGLDLTVTKLAVFVVASAMAGLAGALYGSLQGAVGADQFQFVLSLAFFLAVTMGGAGALSAALAAGVFVAVVPALAAHVSAVPDLLYILAGVGAMSIGRRPNGLAQLWIDIGTAMRARGPAPAAAMAAMGAAGDTQVPAPAPVPSGARRDAGVPSVG